MLHFKIVLLSLFLSSVAFGQEQRLASIGMNAIYFPDWKHRPINYFNPEMRFTAKFNNKLVLDVGLNAFYNRAHFEDIKKTGAVTQRLQFIGDFGVKSSLKKFSVILGPSIRYRNEKIRASCNSCPFWEFRIEPQKGFFDVGIVGGANYDFLVRRKTSFNLRTAYRLFNKGVNPTSIGVFYNKLL